jgi:hypothetical protein
MMFLTLFLLMMLPLLGFVLTLLLFQLAGW